MIGADLLDLSPTRRARPVAIFIAFQYPLEIPAFATMTFMRNCAQRPAKGARRKELSDPAFRRTALRALGARVGGQALDRP